MRHTPESLGRIVGSLAKGGLGSGLVCDLSSLSTTNLEGLHTSLSTDRPDLTRTNSDDSSRISQSVVYNIGTNEPEHTGRTKPKVVLSILRLSLRHLNLLEVGIDPILSIQTGLTHHVTIRVTVVPEDSLNHRMDIGGPVCVSLNLTKLGFIRRLVVGIHSLTKTYVKVSCDLVTKLFD